MSAESIQEVSKADLIFDFMGKIANGFTNAFGFSIELSWFIIFLIILTIVYLLLLFVEKFIQYFRMVLFFLWALTAIAVVIIATQFS